MPAWAGFEFYRAQLARKSNSPITAVIYEYWFEAVMSKLPDWKPRQNSPSLFRRFPHCLSVNLVRVAIFRRVLVASTSTSSD
eukprot:scaffold283622_cov51-Prasinocladus_malaysianus.AAC.2